MAHRVFKRIYTNKALEIWLDYILKPWEHFFAPQALEAGRDYYKQELIRTIEVLEDSAMVEAKFNKLNQYSILELGHKGFRVRGSCESGLSNDALAVAGLYEIEELICDELEAIGSLDIDKASKAPEDNTPCPCKNLSPGRPLHVEVFLENQAILFKVFWVDDKRHKIPALQDTLPKNLTPDTLEREKWIQFTSIARRSKMKPLAHKSAYLLDSTERILKFTQKEWPLLKKYFQVDGDVDVFSKIEGGPQVINLEAHLDLQSNALSWDWSAYLDNKILSKEETHLLLLKKQPMLLLPQRGLITIRKEHREIFEDSCTHMGPQPKYMLFSLFKNKNISVPMHMSQELTDWLQSFEHIKPIEHLPDQLRDYQKEGVHWLAHLCNHDCHGLLADEMGLGKTLQVLTLIKERPIKGKHHIIVCPASVIPVWEHEVARFYPDIPIQVLKKNNAFRDNLKPHVWISSYSQLRRHKERLASMKFGYAVLDEAQQIKNPETKTTQACLHIQACHRIAMTGTPIENKHLDLWTIFRFLMPGLLGSKKNFEDNLKISKDKLLGKIKTQIAPFVIRRQKRDVAKDLPEKVEINLECPLTSKQEDVYIKLCKEGTQQLGERLDDAIQKKTLTVLTLLTRLRQVCCDPSILPNMQSIEWGHSSKIKMLLDKLVEIIDSGHKVVIFSQFVSFLNRIENAIQSELPGTPLYKLTGQTKDRAKPVSAFQQTSTPSIFLASLKAGGTGITLHSADYLFLMDPWWNPSIENQAIDRIHRIGQKNSVIIYRMLSPGTIEDRIQKLKKAKSETFNKILEDAQGLHLLTQHYQTIKDLIQYCVS